MPHREIFLYGVSRGVALWQHRVDALLPSTSWVTRISTCGEDALRAMMTVGERLAWPTHA